MNDSYTRLEDVILDEAFPEVDLALRRGRHIDRDDGPWYALLVDGEEHLVTFYRRFGCELLHKTDGYFFLLPINDNLGRRQLSLAEMLVGQALTLLYLDPATVQHGGVVDREQVLGHLAAVMGTDALVRALNPKRRRYDERVAQETVRSKVAEALRRLAGLGFVELIEGERVRLRPALMRFAEPVRGLSAPQDALARLVAAGEVVLTEFEGESADGESADGESADGESADGERADGDVPGGEDADGDVPSLEPTAGDVSEHEADHGFAGPHAAPEALDDEGYARAETLRPDAEDEELALHDEPATVIPAAPAPDEDIYNLDFAEEYPGYGEYPAPSDYPSLDDESSPDDGPPEDPEGNTA